MRIHLHDTMSHSSIPGCNLALVLLVICSRELSGYGGIIQKCAKQGNSHSYVLFPHNDNSD